MEVSDIICTIEHIQTEATTLHSNTFSLRFFVKSSTQNPTGHTRLFFPGSFLNPKYVCTWRFRWIVLFKIVTYHRRRWVDLKPLELVARASSFAFLTCTLTNSRKLARSAGFSAWNGQDIAQLFAWESRIYHGTVQPLCTDLASIVSSRSISKHIAAIAVICLVHAWLPGSIICCLFLLFFPCKSHDAALTHLLDSQAFDVAANVGVAAPWRIPKWIPTWILNVKNNVKNMKNRWTE